MPSGRDPDATYRVHDDQVDFSYNVSVAATDNFIREIRADTGAQPDAVAIPDLLTTQSEQHDLTPDKFIYDAAACLRARTGRHRQDLCPGA